MNASIPLAVVKDGRSMSMAIASEMTYVFVAMRLSERFAQECGIVDTAKVALVLRELLSNAVFQGGSGASGRSIQCGIECSEDGRVRIVAEVQGEGSDYAGLDTFLPEVAQGTANRGHELLGSACAALECDKNGRRVTAHVEVDGKHRQARNAPGAVGV